MTVEVTQMNLHSTIFRFVQITDNLTKISHNYLHSTIFRFVPKLRLKIWTTY